jgi:hypothetical protein
VLVIWSTETLKNAYKKATKEDEMPSALQKEIDFCCKG